jgi:hypothetical protein
MQNAIDRGMKYLFTVLMVDPPYQRHSAIYTRSDAHEEGHRENSEDLYDTIPRGPAVSSVINK